MGKYNANNFSLASGLPNVQGEFNGFTYNSRRRSSLGAVWCCQLHYKQFVGGWHIEVPSFGVAAFIGTAAQLQACLV